MRYAGSKYTTKADAEAVSRYPSARNYGNEYLMTSSSSMMANRLGCNASPDYSPSNYSQFAGQAAQNCQNYMGMGSCQGAQLGASNQALSNSYEGQSSVPSTRGSLDLLIGSLFGL